MQIHVKCFRRLASLICPTCHEVLGDDVVVLNKSLILHRTCLEREEKESQERWAAQKKQRHLDEIEIRINSVLVRLPRWDHARIDSSVFAKCDHRIQAFARNWRSGSALLLGPSGCGKTTGVIAAMHAFVGRVRQIAEADLESRDLKNLGQICWADGFALANCRRNHPLGQGDPQLMSDANRAWVVIIDELGFEGREASPDILEVVNDRYQYSRPTIVTSGCTLQQFIDRYGGAFVRRLAEKGIGTLIDCHMKGNGQ